MMSRNLRSHVGLAAFVGVLVLVAVLGGFVWLAVVFILAGVLFLHELGHYVTARMTGMKVMEFFIGFGPRVWSFRRGETEYGIKALWLGAYVRIAGMNNRDTLPESENESRTFRAKSYPKKLLVLSAGSLMHFVLAMVLIFVVTLGYGRVSVSEEVLLNETSGWSIGSVLAGTPADEANLAEGDVLVSLNGEPVESFSGFAERVSVSSGQQLEVTYLRDGAEYQRVVTIAERFTDTGAATVDGLSAGDRIIGLEQLNNGGLVSYEQIVEYARTRLGEPVNATIIDSSTGTTRSAELVFNDLLPTRQAVRGFFGVSPSFEPQPAGVITSATDSVKVFSDLSTELTMALPKALSSGVANTFTNIVPSNDDGVSSTSEQNTASNNNENRFVSIFGVAQLGVGLSGYEALILLAYVNIFLGVFNLLPLPPLDGGHIAVATYERLRSVRRKEPYQIEAQRLLPLTYAVVAFLLLIGGVAILRDVFDPITLP